MAAFRRSFPPPHGDIAFVIENGFNRGTGVMDSGDSNDQRRWLQACASAPPRDEHRGGRAAPAAIQMQSVEFAELARHCHLTHRSTATGRPFARRFEHLQDLRVASSAPDRPLGKPMKFFDPRYPAAGRLAEAINTL